MQAHSITHQPDGNYRVWLTERHYEVYVDVTPDGKYIDGTLTTKSKTGRLAFIIACRVLQEYFK